MQIAKVNRLLAVGRAQRTHTGAMDVALQNIGDFIIIFSNQNKVLIVHLLSRYR